MPSGDRGTCAVSWPVAVARGSDLSAIAVLRADGVTVLLVEQNAAAALDISDRGYVMETGRIVVSDKASTRLSDPKVKNAYLDFE
jgi:branched-chain amino acid transport system ATP-binding protein